MKLYSGLGPIARALRYPDFATYTAGSAVSLIGTWTQRVATGWLAWELTGSGFWLGAVAFADLFPTLLVGPIAGAAADRWDRLTVTRTTQSIALVQATALAALTFAGQMSIGLLCVLTAVGGVATAFNQPARLAMIPSLVPRSDLVAALAINSIIFNLARFIGPAIAGFMILTVGVAAAFAVNAVSFLGFLAALSRLHAAPAPIGGPERGSFTDQVVEGMRYARFHKGIAAILVISAITSICSRPVVELLPGFAAEVFRSGADGLAILTSSIGLGAVAGGLWIGGRRDSAGLTRVALACSLAMAAATALFTSTSSLLTAAPLLVLTGFCMSSTGIATQTLLQLAVPGSMRGRVLSLYGLIFRGGPAIGALAMGAASEDLGFRLPVAVGALVAASASIWFLMRQDRFAGDLEQQPAE